MASTDVEVVSPDSTVFSGAAEMVVCRTVDGEIAFLANHTPLIGALVPCVVRLVGVEGGEDLSFAVAGGFVEVSDNKVILLADRAQSPDEVDVEAARSDLADAERRLGEDASDRTAETDREFAEARLELAGASNG